MGLLSILSLIWGILATLGMAVAIIPFLGALNYQYSGVKPNALVLGYKPAKFVIFQINLTVYVKLWYNENITVADSSSVIAR